MNNRPIPAAELIDMICRDRQIANKNKASFSDPVLKARHDELNYDKEVARINDEFS